jgi:hypothetical protein
MSVFLEDLLNCCRCCSKFLQINSKAVEISTSIRNRFFALTGMELYDSELYSSIICESCNSKLSEYVDFRNELKDYQMKLYELGVIKEDFDGEYLEYDIKTEDGQIEELEQIEILQSDMDREDEHTIIEYSESELVATGNVDFYNEFTESEPNFPLENSSKMKKKNTIRIEKECPHCFQMFAASGLYHHIQRSHASVDPRFQCDQCGKGFNLKNDLAVHVQRHLDRKFRKQYPCTVCGSLSALRNHKKVFHTFDAIEPHRCEYCSKVFKTRMKYYQHRRTVHQNQGIYSCMICLKEFPTRVYLDKHITNVHSEKQPCTICNKMYKPASLKRHMFSHAPRQFNCPYEDCDKIYQLKVSLKNHILTHHEKDNTISCEQCGTCFPTDRHLKRHIQRQHTAVSALIS